MTQDNHSVTTGPLRQDMTGQKEGDFARNLHHFLVMADCPGPIRSSVRRG